MDTILHTSPAFKDFHGPIEAPPPPQTAQPVWRVVCSVCGWKYELGEGVHVYIGVARARAHSRKTGHVDIRNRFDLFDCDAGPVDLRGTEVRR